MEYRDGTQILFHPTQNIQAVQVVQAAHLVLVYPHLVLVLVHHQRARARVPAQAPVHRRRVPAQAQVHHQRVQAPAQVHHQRVQAQHQYSLGRAP